MDINATLTSIREAGNFRSIPTEDADGYVDLSSNDYLGFGIDTRLREQFFAEQNPQAMIMSASASRLLSLYQKDFTALESVLSDSYGGRAALLFNSGYHANTGLVSAIASDGHTLIVADRLVHASIIDGIKLSGAPFERFRHNDLTHLERLIERNLAKYSTILVVVESVYSMDGDYADLSAIANLRRRYHEQLLLYVDEAHAVGAVGPGGLGESARCGILNDVDILVGTLGKALASTGAFAILSKGMRDFMVNRARSLIFSTAMPPLCARWSKFIWGHSLQADSVRQQLQLRAKMRADIIPGGPASHIRPLIVGDASGAVELSWKLLNEGFKVLPIRTPTVPPGTERLRFSLSAAIPECEILRLGQILPIINKK